MKKIAFLMLLLGLLWSCKNDDDPAPSVLITSISPEMGKPGDEVTITGAGFDEVIGNNLAQFNGTAAVIKSATSTQLTVEVPEGVTTGEVTVTVTNKGQASGGTFTFENLIATLQYVNEEVSVTEGEAIIVDLTLDQVLSQEVVLKAQLDIPDKVNAVKASDYSSALEYSTNEGTSWQSESDESTLKIPAGTKAIKVRVATVQDELPETNENLFISFTQTSALDQLTLPTQELSVTINDDDPGTTSLEEGTLAIYTRDASGNYVISSTAAELPASLEEYGLPGPSELLEDVSKHQDVIDAMVKLIPASELARIDQLELIYSDGLFGYVYPSNSPAIDKWNMGLNVAIAHPQGVFDGDGEITYTIVHEYGHILTLNDTQLDATTSENNCSFFFIEEGCSKSTSYLSPFYTNYWEGDVIGFFNNNDGEGLYNQFPGHFVTEYASSHIAEDIAEVFATFITQEEIPNADEMSTIALKKLNSLMSYQELITLRTQMRATGLIKQLNTPIKSRQKKSGSIRFANRDSRTGKFVSCTAVHRH